MSARKPDSPPRGRNSLNMSSSLPANLAAGERPPRRSHGVSRRGAITAGDIAVTDMAWREDERRALLAELVEHMPVGVCVTRPDGTPVFANAAARRTQPPSPDAEEECESGGRAFLRRQKKILFREQQLNLSVAVDITERKRLEDQLARRAHHDELTGLPNRALFQQRVEQALERKEAFAVAVIDIDGFKQINEHYGHDIGDAFLIKAAARIGRLLRETDLLARVVGDEFLLMLHPVARDEEVEDIVNTLVEAMKEPFSVDGFEIFSSASVGIACAPEHGRDYETLRRNADHATDQVKRGGVLGAAAVFRQELHETETERVIAGQRLRLAIKDRQFRCAFQPKVDINTEEVYGVEALARLIDEDGEVHGPGSFIPLATELGLMSDVTHLIVQDAIDSLDAINEAFGPQTTISVNIPAKQAADVDFMRSIAAMLQQSFCPERFMIEVTEDAFVAKNRFQSQIVPMLRAMGARVSIDDFGTGYSSLSALAEITADELKVDRTFITKIHERPRSQIVLRAIESLGAALGMSVIAEGVETFEELLYLKSATRIRHVQGYYFARPMLLDSPAAKKRASEGARVGRAATAPAFRRPVARRSR